MFLRDMPSTILMVLSSICLALIILLVVAKIILFIFHQRLEYLENKPSMITDQIKYSVSLIINFISCWEHAKIFPPDIIDQLTKITNSSDEEAEEKCITIERYIPSALCDESTLEILNMIFDLKDLIQKKQIAKNKWENQQNNGDPKFIQIIEKIPFVF